MNRAARPALVDRDDPTVPISQQCRLLKVAHSTLYHQASPVSDDDRAVMRALDEQYLETPFYGARRMVIALGTLDLVVNRKRVRRLMRVMGLEAIYQKPNTSRRHPAHKVYPYLLRGLVIDRPNQVWCADITDIRMTKGFVYLVVIMDWFSRRVLAWRVSISLDTDFCVKALREAIDRHGKPTIFHTDQGVQFTSAAFIDELADAGVRISMDGKGRFLDNIFIERLWRSLKYEEVFIKSYGSVAAARAGIGGWITFYNDRRYHQALGYRTPRAVFENPAPACGKVDSTVVPLRSTPALPTFPQAHRQEREDAIFGEDGVSDPDVIPQRVGVAATGRSLASPGPIPVQWMGTTSECQLDLFADRTSTATMAANQLRLWFASFAYALVPALRRIGLAGTQLANATCGTIRLRRLKIGVLVRIGVRRVVFAMASGCPRQAEFARVHAVLRRSAA
jgi:putative transposase